MGLTIFCNTCGNRALIFPRSEEFELPDKFDSCQDDDHNLSFAWVDTNKPHRQ